MHDIIALVSVSQIIILIQKIGYVGLFAIIFLESFPPTLFLPGDSLLFTTGFLASQGILAIGWVIPTVFVAGVLGYLFSYSLGAFIIRRFFTGQDTFLFKKRHLQEAREFFEKYGAKAVVIGRFIPVIRSFVPTVAGAAGMHYGRFLRYTIFGTIFWSFGMTLLGYYLGKVIPNVTSYLTPIIIAIVIISILPGVIEYWNKKHTK
jgi:membrane-associated protein